MALGAIEPSMPPVAPQMQCRERYMNVLNPEVCRAPWSRAELAKLQRLCKQHLEGAAKPAGGAATAAGAAGAAAGASGDGAAGTPPVPAKPARGKPGKLPWAAIVQQLPGRTDASCKEAWKSLQRCATSWSFPLQLLA